MNHMRLDSEGIWDDLAVITVDRLENNDKYIGSSFATYRDGGSDHDLLDIHVNDTMSWRKYLDTNMKMIGTLELLLPQVTK